MAVSTKPFRFLDLPRELRDEIYKLHLCSIEPPVPESIPLPHPLIAPRGHTPGKIHEIPRVKHSIDVTILRTCKQIHREAYDIMVKTNKFIHISSTGLCLDHLLASYQVPFVTMDRIVIERFKGYVMKLSMTSEDAIYNPGRANIPDAYLPNYDIMLLERDWPLFCKMLARGGDALIESFSSMANMDLTLYPWNDDELPDYKESIKDFFTVKTQERFLAPFRKMRGFSAVLLDGYVDTDLQIAVEGEVEMERFLDTKSLLSTLATFKEIGDKEYKAGNFQAASEQYGEAMCDFRSLRAGASWGLLVEEGGPPFLSTLAELYAKILLNAAQNSIKWMQTPRIQSPSNKQILWLIGDGNYAVLHDLLYDLPLEFEDDGGQWDISEKMCVKGHYRLAVTLRLIGRNSDWPHALKSIEMARLTMPEDALIVREHQEIVRWGAVSGF